MTQPSTSPPPPPPPPPPLIPNFPDDVALQIIARIPRSYRLDISLVCKSWRSILRSPLYFSIRSQLNCTQLFLYINVRIRSSFKWFILDPNHSNPKALISLPPLPIQAIGSAFAILDSKIYVIGGSINEIPSSNVWVFDSRFNCWEPGPKMKVGREFGAAGVINGKIYVIGGCSIDNWTRSTHWAEVFDPKMGTWTPVPCPLENKEKWMHGSAVIDNKMYAMADRGGVAFDPVNSFWGYVSTELDLGWRGRAAVVDDILYCYDYLGRIRGFDAKEYIWRTLKGLEKDLPKFLCGATMANLGGKLCVVWEGHGSGRQIQVSCAEIEVRKDCFGDLWGSIVWSQVFPEIPGGSSIVNCLAVDV